MTDSNLKQLRKRFVKDTDIPIQVFESPYFEDRLELFEESHGAATKYKQLQKTVEENFNGNTSAFLEYYNSIKEKIITTVSESEAFKAFQSDNTILKNYTPIAPSRKLYTQEQDGCMFVSFDMKKANFQTLRYINPSIVLNCNTYEEFIGKFTDLWYFKESKYSRQRIFGELNPKRTRKVEEEVTNEFALSINEELTQKNLSPFAFNGDEVIYKFNGTEGEFEKLTDNDRVYKGITFRFSKFKLHHRQFLKETSNTPLDVYEKEDYLNSCRRILKGVPDTYYPQVYKLLIGEKISPYDLIFYYEGELCTFNNPLKLIK